MSTSFKFGHSPLLLNSNIVSVFSRNRGNQSRWYRRTHCQDILSIRTCTRTQTNAWSITAQSYYGSSAACCQVSVFVCICVCVCVCFKEKTTDINLQLYENWINAMDVICVYVIISRHSVSPTSAFHCQALFHWPPLINEDAGLAGFGFYSSTCILWN